MKHRITLPQRIFAVFNYIFLSLLALSMFLPLLNVIAQSLSSPGAIDRGEVYLWPVETTMMYYEYVFSDFSIWRAFGISVYITIVGTIVNLVATASLAYPLSRPEFLFRKAILLGVVFTMIFTAPLIPQFILMKHLHLMNTLWALIIPTAISAFNLIVMRSFFTQIPGEVIDSARIDGCGEARMIWSIIVPLSKPVMATTGIFYSVMHWNTYQHALYYINDRTLYPLQVKLREMLITDNFVDTGADVFSSLATTSPQGIQMAVIVVATLPMVIVYPFLQRYFIKGMLIGSIKS